MEKKLLFFIFLCISIFNNHAQQIWEQKTNNLSLKKYYNGLNNSKSLKLNKEYFLSIVKNAPGRNDIKTSNQKISLPVDENNFEVFEIFETSNFNAKLNQKFPSIKSYIAKSIASSKTARLSYDKYTGLHASIFSNSGTLLIKPTNKETNDYLFYNRADIDTNSDFECKTIEQIKKVFQSKSRQLNSVNDGYLRKYRVAIAATGEYSNFFLTGSETNDEEKKGTVLAAINNSLTRINGIFERDFGVTMELISSNDQLIFLDANTDPFNAGNYNQELQTTLDNIIGTENYDVGHVFIHSNRIYGNAGCIACVCTEGEKGSAFSAHTDPSSDDFNMLASHEFGHQFGGYHVQSSPNCRSGNNSEVEPGSGSSIMGYAGICSPNTQENPDDYFNYVDIRDVIEWTRNGSSCAELIPTGNNDPTVDAGQDYSIPISTPFILTGTADDTDNNTLLTYCWEQNDPENVPSASTPESTWHQGPLFRSKLPVSTSTRYFPQLEDVINGNLTPTWEVLPSVARTMDFALTVRDNAPIGPKTASDLMTVTVVDNGGAFSVTSQKNNETWNVGDIKTITWNVAGTNKSPINATNVEILLSLDGGYTYPHTISSNISNSGSATIIVPEIPQSTTEGRIMIKPIDNIFYAINTANITIQVSEFAMIFSETNQNICKPNNIEYNFIYKTFLDFNEETIFSVENLPNNLAASFEPTNAIDNNTPVKLTITNTSDTDFGEIQFNVTGTSEVIERKSLLSFNLYGTEIVPPTLSLPENNSSEIDNTNITLEWNLDENISNYTLELASDSSFNTILESTTSLINSHIISTNLDFNTTYYWRVKGDNLCGESDYSNTFLFTTKCFTPIDIVATNITLNSADISWIDTSNSTNWEVEVVTSGAMPLGVGSLTTTKPFLLNNLNSDTRYDVYVRSHCSNSNYSEWVGPYSFDTLANFCNGDKFYDSGGENGIYSNNENKQTLITPTNGDIVEINFESFHVENGYDYLTIYDGNDINAPLIGSYTGTNSPGTIRSKFGQGITFVFTSDNIETRDGWTATVNCISVTCPEPTEFSYSNLLGNSVDLSWVTNGTENQWEIEYGITGFAKGNGNKILTTTNPTTTNSLTTATTYDFYITAICGTDAEEDNSFTSQPLTITTPLCGIYTAPYTFNVEDQNTNTTIEHCWNGEPQVYNGDYFWEAKYSESNQHNTTGPYKANTGNHYFRTRDYGSSTNDEALLVSPLIDISSLTTPTLNFHSFMYGEFIGSLHVDIFNNGAWTEDIFVLNGQQQETITDFWKEHFIDLSTYTDQIQIRFRGISNGNYNNEIAIDDINVYNLPNCIKPSDFEYTNVTATTVDLSWTANGNGTSWIVEYGTPNFSPGTGTSVITNTNNFTLENLPANSEIEIYIKSTCGNNPGDDDSDNVGPIKITTPCDVFSTPYSFNVEDQNTNSLIENCWSGEPEVFQTSYFWEAKQSRLYENSTGPYKAYTGNHYFSTRNYGSSANDEAKLISPIIDISSLSTPTLNFHSFMYGEYISSLHVDIFNNGTWTEDVFVLNGQQQESSNDFWEEHFIDLSAYTDQIQVRFRGITNGSYNNEIAIDDINIYNLPNCIKPSNLEYTNVTATSVDLSWTANGNGTSWIVEYGDSGFIPGEGTSVTANTNNYTLENLPSNSELEIYVKSTCGSNPGEDDSDNIGPFKIKTLCGVFTAPYSFNVEDQNTNTIIENCWSGNPEPHQANYYWLAKQSSFYQGNTGPNKANTGNNYFSVGDNGSTLNDEANLLSPVIDISSLTTPTLNFHSFMYGEDIVSLHVDIFNNGIWNSDVFVINGQQQESSVDFWEEHFIDLSAYTNQIQVRFRSISNGNYNNEVAIDDINVYNLPSCIKPSNLEYTNVTATSVDLSWTANGVGTSWIVEYGNPGFIPGTGNSVIANNNNYTLENLPSNSQVDIYIKSTCGNNPGENDSDTIGPLKIKTPCDIFTAPYTFNVEDQIANTTIQNCWSEETDRSLTNYFWIVKNSRLYPYTTGPYKANSGNSYFSTTNYGSATNDEAILLSPIIDISSLTTPTLNFHSFMYGENIGSLKVDLFYNGTWNEDIFVIDGQQQESSTDFWEEHFIDLSTYTGQIQVRFRAISNGNNNNEIAIDDINIYDLPNCIKPSNLTYTNITDTSVDLSWTANGNGTSWIIEYGTSGFTIGSGTSIIANSNNYILENLPSNSEIDIYITSTCGNNPGEDDSAAIGPIKINTLCSSFIAPWYYDVENQNTNSVIADCWSGNPQILQDNYYWATQNSRQSNTTGPNQTNSRNKYFSAESNNSIVSNEANLLSPIIDISSLNIPSLNFFTFMYGENIGSLKVDIFNNGTWNEGIFVLTGQQQESNNDSWREHFIDLSAYTGEIQIRFRASSNSNYNDHIAIDDISVIERPTCIKPTGITFDSITESSVNINWISNDTETTQYTIEYGSQGFLLGSGTQNNTNENTYAVTNLASDTTYDFYIRTECSNGNNSEWIGPFTRKTTPDYCNGDHFYDTGGPNGSYSNQENYTTTIYPKNTNSVVTVEFNSFQLESCCDRLYIYDGIDINAPLIGFYNGNSPGTITSTDSSGALTFRFTSDSSVTGSGWDATVICNSTTCLNPTNLIVEEISIDNASINWDAGGSETNWIIEYGKTGFSLGNGTEIETTERPLLLDNLNSQTTYDVYVKANCNNEVSSSIKTTFTTKSNYCNGDRFYDSGGENNNYSDNENYTETILPTEGADRIRVTFNSFDLENCCDFLSIYDGSDINAPLIGTYNGVDNPGTIAPTNEEGSLTFVFTSNDFSTSSGWDASVTCEYDCAVPSNPVVENITTNEATLTWDAGDSEQNWEVLLAIDNVIVNFYQVDTNNYTFTNLDPSTTYQYGIRANCGGNSEQGNSEWLGSFTFKTEDTCPIPTDASAQNISQNEATLNWNAGGSEQNWEIEYGTDGFTQNNGTKVNVTTNSYIITSLEVSTLYQYYIRANCGTSTTTDDSKWIGPFSFATADITCFVPTDISAQNITQNEATITWNAGGSEQNWEIEYGIDGFTQNNGTKINASTNNYVVTNLEASTLYQYYIRANCGNNNSDDSEWAGPFSFQTSCNAILAPFHEKFVSSTTPDCWIHDNTQNWNYDTNAIYNSNSIPDHSSNGNSNYAWVNSSASNDSNIPSSLKTGFIDISSLNSPRLQFAVFSQNSVDDEYNNLTVKLNDSSGNSFVLIELQGKTENDWQVFNFNINDYTMNDNNIQVEFIVNKNNSSNSSDNNILIDDIKVGEEASLSTENIENIKGFSFYPNPVNNRLTIKSSEVITKIEVYNLLGQKIIRKKLNQELYINDLDLSELSTGNYLIKVYADNKIKTFRIIKN